MRQQKNVYSVGQVNNYIKNMFTQDFLLKRIYVRGEVSNCKYHPSGHIYFSLKDENSRIDCVMFRTAAYGLQCVPRDGMRVVALSDIEYVEVSKHDRSYHLAGEEEPLVVYGSLVAFEQEVEGGPFVRISNSCLVNMNRVRAVRGSELVMHGGEVLYFSRSRKRDAVATITSFLGGSI